MKKPISPTQTERGGRGSPPPSLAEMGATPPVTGRLPVLVGFKNPTAGIAPPLVPLLYKLGALDFKIRCSGLVFVLVFCPFWCEN